MESPKEKPDVSLDLEGKSDEELKELSDRLNAEVSGIEAKILLLQSEAKEKQILLGKIFDKLLE